MPQDHPADLINGTFLTINAVKLKVEKDNGNDEFELYTSLGENPEAHPFRSLTSNIFDGNSWNDASGRPRTYPDVNHKNINYTCNTPIAVKILDAVTSVRIVAIEDDNRERDGKGYYDRTSATSPIQEYVDYYNMELDQTQKGALSKYAVYRPNWKNDDRYLRSGIRAINSTNLMARLSGNPNNTKKTDDAQPASGVLQDINWTFGIVTY